jgi:MFS family permease
MRKLLPILAGLIVAVLSSIMFDPLIQKGSPLLSRVGCGIYLGFLVGGFVAGYFCQHQGRLHGAIVGVVGVAIGAFRIILDSAFLPKDPLWEGSPGIMLMIGVAVLAAYVGGHVGEVVKRRHATSNDAV